MAKTDPHEVAVGDIVRGYSQTTNTIIKIVVDIVWQDGGRLRGVTGRQVNDDGTVKDRKKRYISLYLPGSEDGFDYIEDLSTGERSKGGWTYPDITLKRGDERKGRWAKPLRELGVGATIDFDCTSRDVDTVRNVAAREHRNWQRRYKVEATLTGCAVTRLS